MTISKGYFVTGTDTNVGKTWSTLALMGCLQQQGLTVVGMKPVAAGCEWRDGGWKNTDAVLLQQQGSLVVDYSQINPYAFEQAVSPHVACAGQAVDLGLIRQICTRLQSNADQVVVEGAGGWFSPLDEGLTNADLAAELGLPIILVVGVRLGCINHAMLTWRAIQQSGLPCAGWLAVTLERQMPAFQDNLVYLQQAIDAPMLGVLPHLDTVDVPVLASRVCL